MKTHTAHPTHTTPSHQPPIRHLALAGIVAVAAALLPACDTGEGPDAPPPAQAPPPIIQLPPAPTRDPRIEQKLDEIGEQLATTIHIADRSSLWMVALLLLLSIGGVAFVIGASMGSRARAAAHQPPAAPSLAPGTYRHVGARPRPYHRRRGRARPGARSHRRPARHHRRPHRPTGRRAGRPAST